MVIDIIFCILMLMAVFKGYSRGFIASIFSFVAIIIALAAALKLSTVVAGWLQHSTNIAAKWLPFLSFIIVMVGCILIIKLIAAIIQKSAEFLMMGWINRLGGIVFYALIYAAVFSIILFYADKLHLLKQETFSESKVYSFTEPLGVKIIDGLAKIIPFFKDMFTELETFFDSVGKGMK
ncbi:colicin V production protein [mine drainage metagenome]|uniref:Colicin V production protein n=1 Tax=mine drainage metagenome TaxID=410659 RepID=A0A1J5SA00_9ZZZZ